MYRLIQSERFFIQKSKPKLSVKLLHGQFMCPISVHLYHELEKFALNVSDP